MQVAPGIHRVEAPVGDRVNALHLLIGNSAALLVDTGLSIDPEASISPYLQVIGVPADRLRFVVNTHADVDHMGGNRAVRRIFPRALLMCGERDRPLIEDLERMIAERYGEFGHDHGLPLEEAMAAWCRASGQDAPIDLGLAGGESLDLGDQWRVTIVSTPGHSAGSICVWDPRSRSLIAGDAVLGDASPTADGQPAFPPTYRHVDDYVRSIDAIAALRPELLLTGHEPALGGTKVTDFLDTSRDFVERAESAVVSALRGGPRTLRALTEEFGPVLGRWPTEADTILRYPLLGHLERLVSRGLAVAEPGDGVLVYRWRGG